MCLLTRFVDYVRESRSGHPVHVLPHDDDNAGMGIVIDKG